MKHLLIALLLLCAAAPSYAASCRVTEYRALALDSQGRELQLPLEPSVATQIVSYTTATSSSAFNLATRFIRATAAIAAAHPGVDFLGVEMHLPGIGALLRRIDAQRLTNVRVMRHDAVDVVEAMLAPASLAGVHVYFPDPWPKKRHHKRRLLKPAFVHALATRLAPGGYLHVATDWEPYAGEILATLSSEPLLGNSARGYAPRPAWRPLTKFEQRGLDRGHCVFDILFTRSRASA